MQYFEYDERPDKPVLCFDPKRTLYNVMAAYVWLCILYNVLAVHTWRGMSGCACRALTCTLEGLLSSFHCTYSFHRRMWFSVKM